MQADALLHTSEVVTIVGGAVAILATLFSAVALITTINYRTKTLDQFKKDVTTELKQLVYTSAFEKFRHEAREEYKELAGKVVAVSELLKVQLGRQEVINQIATSSLEGLIRRIEYVESEVRRWHA